MAKVLLIEDGEELVKVLSMEFEDNGYEVIRAQDGAAGLALVAQQSPDLIVSDVNMPRMDDFTLCKQLRSDGNLIPIILLTARDNEIDEALELGADDRISKPFSTRVLLARIAALLRREAAPRSRTEVSALHRRCNAGTSHSTANHLSLMPQATSPDELTNTVL